jgi:flagellar hook-basal body complex protein FliE
MSIAIPPIGAIAPISAPTLPTAVGGPAASGGSDFAAALGQGLDAVSGAQSNAANLAVQAASGQSVDPSAYMIASTQASLMTQLATTVQSKAIAAFNTVMGMQA